jgi:hypothetical protein
MATNNNNMLAVSQLNIDLVAQFGYRAEDFGFIANNSQGSVHMIWGVVSPVGLLASVPNGSIFTDVVTKIMYVKQGAAATAGVGSGIGGTWVAMTGA